MTQKTGRIPSLVERRRTKLRPLISGLPLFPAQARLDLATEFPKVDQHQQLRIELEAASPAIRYWAFVSITNNQTQHVTLVVPGEREND